MAEMCYIAARGMGWGGTKEEDDQVYISQQLVCQDGPGLRALLGGVGGRLEYRHLLGTLCMCGKSSRQFNPFRLRQSDLCQTITWWKVKRQLAHHIAMPDTCIH